MEQFIDKMNDGGPFFMYSILALLILILVLFVKGLLNRNSNNKTIALLSSIGFFTLVWGLLGQTFGLIMAFDSIQVAGSVSMSIIAGGLKVSLLTTLFGFITFLVSRFGIIVLIWLQKEKTE